MAWPPPPSAPTAVATPTPTAATVDDFCDAKLAVDEAFLAGGPPDETATPSPSEVEAALRDQYGDVYDELQRTAQDEVSAEVATLVRLAESAIDDGNGEFFFDEDFAGAEAEVDDYLVENCGFEEIRATTADYEFTGVPLNIPAGKTALTITNEGEEFHEMILLRINDDVDLSVEELLALPEEEAMGMTSPPSSVTLAVPGQTATAFADLAEGRYIVTCFISKDSTAENDFNGDGPPHFVDGMFEELIVGDAPAGSPSPGATSASGSASGSSASSSEASATPTAD